MDVFTFVILIVLITSAVTVIKIREKSKSAASSEVGSELSRQVESLSRRVATLEKIVTDQKYQLARDIDELEELERHKA